jgi:outer membrane lipoprotein-sorting protein
MLETNANHDVDELIRRRAQMEAPAEVESRLRGRLAEFRTKVEQRPERLRTLASFPVAVRVAALAATLLLAVAVGVVLIPGQSRAGQVFAAAAAQLRSSQSLEYTIVLNAEPYVAVDFSYLAPGYRRINCSWGIEVRTDGTTGKQIVLFHGGGTYLTESGKQVESVANTEDFAAQLRSLPQKADEVLGEQRSGGRRLIGYRLHHPPQDGSSTGLKQLDIWIDGETREAHHVDITVQEPGKPAHQMHIRNIRAGGEVNRSLFDLTPPAGYTAFPIPRGEPRGGANGPAAAALGVQAQIAQGDPLTAVVMPMQGPYAQTQTALQAVEGYLRARNVTPVGPPFGRYGSEQHWDAGYPVPVGTRGEAPFQVISMPGTLTASAVVTGGWGQDSEARWGAFLKSVVEQGYAPGGPAMEMWRGEAGAGQATEMRMAVTKAK